MIRFGSPKGEPAKGDLGIKKNWSLSMSKYFRFTSMTMTTLHKSDGDTRDDALLYY